MTFGSSPTIVDKMDFDPIEAAKALFKAVEGLGTDETSIVQVVASCSNQQRQEIRKEFYNLYKKDLIKEFKTELRICLSLDFKQLLESLFMNPDDFDANRLKKSVKGLGTDEKALVEILLTRSKEQLNHAKEKYTDMFGVSLEKDVADDTSGDFRKIVYSLSRAAGLVENAFKIQDNANEMPVKCLFRRLSSAEALRDGAASVDREKARQVAEEIHQTYTDYRGTDTPRFDFIRFCCSENFNQMKAVFEEYHILTGNTIIKFIEKEFHGDACYALKGAVRCSQSVAEFLAERLWKSLDRIGNDETLIRIIVSRSEVDLEDIKTEFKLKYHKSLEAKIKHHKSGQFKHLLLALVRGNAEK